MRRISLSRYVNAYKSSSAKGRDAVYKMAAIHDGPAFCHPTQKCLRPNSSPCRVYSRNGSHNMSRPSSSNTEMANPVLSFLDVKRILFEKITDRGNELKRAFQLLDPGQTMTVSKSELKRIITVFLLPLTREQFRDVLAQIPLTSSGAVPYSEFLNKFGGIDLNINVIKRGNETEKKCCRKLREIESQVGEKMGQVLYTAALTPLPSISLTICSSIHVLPNSSLTNDKKLGDIPLILKNIKAVTKAFRLVDVNRTGLIHRDELRRILEIFCMRLTDEEYKKFAKHYNIDKDAAVNYNVFMKDLSVNNDLNLKYFLENQEDLVGNQQYKCSRKENFFSSISSEDIWKKYPLDEVKKNFCQEFSKAYEHVEKALSAGDPSQSGFVSLNYLKIVLDTFVCQLPRRVFIQLMKRFGLRATSKINWKQFMALFPEPHWLEANNAIPLVKKSNINCRNQSLKGNIAAKLFGQGNHYTSLKKALLIINNKPDGHLTAEELRHLLNCMVIKISDSEFEELMQNLDPCGSRLVNINEFIELLEQNHKMKKAPSYADTKEPPPVAWDPVEEIIRDAISKNLHAFRDILQSYDPGAITGLISCNNFQRVMNMYCPFLTADHFTKLSSKFQDVATGKILYKKFLASIGVNKLPSSPAPVPKDQLERQWTSDLPERTKATKNESTVTRNMTMDEVLHKLKACIQKQDPAFRKRFLDFSKELCCKINEHDFRKVLEGNGMHMNNYQYSLLTAKLGYKPEGMSYLDFAARFSDNKKSGLEVTPSHTPVTSKSSRDSIFMTAEECLKHFPQRLKEFFRDPYSAFFKIDTDRDGIINMHDLRRLLMQLLFSLKDEEFLRFLNLLGLKVGVTLNFREFQSLLEKTPSKADEAPQRLIRPKQKVADAHLACEQAHQYLATKARNRWSDLSKNFLETDNEGNGILRRRDIKNALYGFDIPLTPREFEKLWTRYDTEGRGYITYQDFLQKLGIDYSADLHRPYVEDYFNFMGHFTKPQQLQEEIKELHQREDKAKSIREKLKMLHQEISTALTKHDKSKTGYISVCRMVQVLQECGCSLTEEELTQLLHSWRISCQNSSINYLDFLRLLESKSTQPQPEGEKESVPVDFSVLHPEDVLKNMQEVVAACTLPMATAFFALDREDTGFLKASDFGQVLKDFCYKFTENQYHYFLRKLRLHLTPYINWKYFLQNFSSFLEENAAEWAEKMPKGPPPPTPKETAHQEILDRLRRVVVTHYHTIAQELENFDTMKTNTVSRDEFRAICTRHVQVLTDEQFDRLWREMPVNAKGRLKCQDFLSSFSCEKAETPQASMETLAAQRESSVPATASSGRKSTISSRDLKSRSKHPYTPGSAPQPAIQPLQNCEPIESKLRKRIQSCWRELLRNCKEKDTDKQGDISATEFLALMEKFNMDISKEECQQLLVKYDLRNNGRFSYCDFIQSCVLLLKSKETSLMQRMKIQNANKMEETGAETSSLYCALLRIQPQILHCWRPMRRTFKSYDETSSGFLSVGDFRKVLRQYSINLSEEEFFHILEYYDKTLSSKISYNDFLRAFLQ